MQERSWPRRLCEHQSQQLRTCQANAGAVVPSNWAHAAAGHSAACSWPGRLRSAVLMQQSSAHAAEATVALLHYMRAVSTAANAQWSCTCAPRQLLPAQQQERVCFATLAPQQLCCSEALPALLTAFAAPACCVVLTGPSTRAARWSVGLPLI